MTLPQSPPIHHKSLLTCTTPTWELTATISLTSSCTSVGFHVRHNPSSTICTTISFSPQDETLAVSRTHSTPLSNINTCPEFGPFTLFTTLDPITKTLTQEDLHLRVFSDSDVLEVFANERFALATTVYSGDYVENAGITAFAEGGEGSAVFRDVEVWDGLNGGRGCVVEEVEVSLSSEKVAVEEEERGKTLLGALKM